MYRPLPCFYRRPHLHNPISHILHTTIIMFVSVNVAAELSAANDSYVASHFSKHVLVDDDKIINIVIDTWRNACAAYVAKGYGITSVIIDGIPIGPAPTEKAEWKFIISRPYVIVEEWKVVPNRKGAFKTMREMKVNVRVDIGYKETSSLKDGKRAVWRAYLEINNEQRGQLFAAIDDARHGRPAVRRESTLTFPDGYPRSA